MGSAFSGVRFQAIGTDPVTGKIGPLPFAELETCAAGTLTPLATYTTENLASPNPTTVICDAKGQADIWVGSPAYRFRLFSSTASGRVLQYDKDNWKGPGAVTADMLAALAATGGAALVGSQSTGTGSLATTVAARLAGGCVYLWPEFTTVTNGTTDITTAVQNAVIGAASRGKALILNIPISISTVNVDGLGQIVMGMGRGVTDVLMVSGGKGFRFRARNTALMHMRFIPPSNVAGVQSSLVADCCTIQGINSDDEYIEGFLYEGISCENIKGAAIRMVSPLRESMINDFRWHGMGNSGTGVGAFHCTNLSNTNRSPNNITVSNGSVYRFAVPWINFTIQDLGVSGRSEPPYAQIRIENVLSHGQLVDENAVPSPLSVSPENCDHIYIKCVEGLYINNVIFSAVHPNKYAARVDQYTTYAINKSISIHKCYATYGITVPGIPANTTGAVSGGAAGGYFKVTDCIDLSMEGNHVAAGYYQYDFDHRDSGAHSTTLVTDFTGNQSNNQFQPIFNAPDWYNIYEAGKITLKHITPLIRMAVPGSDASMYLFADGAGSLRIDLDPTNVASATRLDIFIDNQLQFSLDKDGVVANIKYIQMVPVAPGTAPVRSMFVPSSGGSTERLCYKDSGGGVNATY